MTYEQTMIYKTLHDIGTHNDLQNTTWHQDKQWSTKHYMTYGQTMIYKKHYMTSGQTMIYKTLHDIRTNNDLKTLHDIGTNNDLQNTTWHMDKQWSTKHYMT